MDLDSAEVSRERATSSEPPSSRPKPFDDRERSARKRQRLSSETRSRSAGSASHPTSYDTPPKDSSPATAESCPARPHTPTRTSSETTTPNSSKVTINLRSSKILNGRAHPPSPSPSSSASSKMTRPDPAVASETEQKPIPAAAPSDASTSSSSSTLGSPAVELVMDEDEASEYSRSPPVAIIDNDNILLDADPVLDFPYASSNEHLAVTARKVAHVFEYESLDSDDMFCKLRDWMESYLQATRYSPKSWCESYERHKDFWDRIPDIVAALSRRRSFFGVFLHRSREGRQALMEFFGQFAALTARFIAMDARTLDDYDNDSATTQPILASRPYCMTFGWLIQKREFTIGHNLETHYQFDWDAEALALTRIFLENGGDFPTVTRYVKGNLALMARNPKVIEDLTEPCRIMDMATTYSLTIDSAETAENIRQGFQLYQVLAPALNRTIEKHATSLTVESALTQIAALAKMYYAALNLEDSPLEETLLQYAKSYPTLLPKYLPSIISMEWKFDMFRKLLTSGQMQLRVAGVAHMCSELLDLFQRFKGDDPSRQSTLIHFSRYIMSNKLVDYLVGPGSHPELISEIGSIVGFLVVTKVYTDKETDAIWHTVTTSHDPRVVEAILRMLSNILNLFEENKLLYLCDKAKALPIEAFTPAMRDYSHRIFNQLLEKAANVDRIQTLSAPPYELCVRLIKESSVPRPEAPLGLLEIQHWATTRLRELVLQGPESEVRDSIYLSCIKDISSKTPTASGSICALFGLLSSNVATDLHILTTNHKLTPLIVEDIEFTNKSSSPNSVPAYVNSPVRQARRDLLLSIILREPTTLTPDLGRRLWDAYVGEGARTLADREVAWSILNNAAAKASTKNPFIETCFKEYLPTLTPKCYTLGSLDFVREHIYAWLRESTGDSLDEDQAFRSHGIEQLWRMVLTAPPKTIEDQAINMMVEIYVDSPVIQTIAKPRALAVHLKLVNRCLKQLSYAARKLNDPSANKSTAIAAAEHASDEELIFTRSLVLLREFLRSYQTKPRFAMQKPKPSVPIPQTTEVKGTVQVFKYQTFKGTEHGPVGSLNVGSLNTISDLFAMIRSATGFKNFRLYHWGVELHLSEAAQNTTFENSQIGNGLLLVTKQDDEQFANGTEIGPANLEAEIVNHFDAFWDYLGMEERLAKEIYHFLVKFPVYPKLLAAFEDDNTEWSEIFTLKQPFRCLYVVYALRENLKARTREGVPDGRMLARSLSLMVSTITNQEVLDSCEKDELKGLVAQTLVDCLVQLLREPIPADALATQLTSNLLECLLKLLRTALVSATAKNSVPMVSASFEAILEASLRNRQFWLAFITSPSTPLLLRELLLEDPRTSLRKSVMKQINSKCTYTDSLSTVSMLDVATAFWPLLFALIPSAVAFPDRCEETFSAARTVFRTLAEASVANVDLNACLLQWGSLLLEHTPEETIEYLDEVDSVARGLSSLLYCCTSFYKSSEQPIPSNHLAVELFSKHLFPELLDREDDEFIPENMPVFNSITRKYLSDAIVNLTRDDAAQYREVMGLVKSLTPYDSRDQNPYAYELPYGFDRSKSIRSPSGYVGLRNLSNTCYLNSLTTQLFMNVSFREFLLNVRVADPYGSSQLLLYETQKLFASMQNSFKRFVDPSGLALSIRTYDDTNIDVSVQMDVDEFYNLLFDRWEGQIQSPVDRRQFRSFYGGQLVQQVKSEECTHISERLEPFSAIQCDIKGKSSLQESLQAYVDGEIMEGDNKYKCSTCDLHVNAVKRACLQDIPDNLIFHLKRFDFNLRTMQRSKINDYFSFPHKIDLRPYKVEHLMNPAKDIPEDVFELVGILVHSGTAESGHYYSYIRERPSYANPPAWVEFNDDQVTSFDPATIESTCFGGLDFRSPENGSFQFDKSWSAYMLFYQRSSVVQLQQQELMVSKSLRTLRMPVPQAISNAIAEENEFVVRKYCLYDESHPKFVQRMFENTQHLSGGGCSANHNLERLASSALMLHLDQVVARAKDIPDFASYMVSIDHRLKTCTSCSENFLEWLIQQSEAFRQMLMRNPEPLVRGEIALAVVTALSRVKQFAINDYGLRGYESAVEDDADVFESPSLFPRLIETMLELWDSFHFSIRSWPEYFGLLIRIARLGVLETASLLDADFFVKVLEMLTADPAMPPHPQYTRMLSIMQKRPVTKPVALDNVIGLLECFLKACDLSPPPINDVVNRTELVPKTQALPLNNSEYNLLLQHWTRTNVNILAEKLLGYNQNPRATQSIIAMMLERLDDAHANVFAAIRHGIKKTPMAVSFAPYITAALTYCRVSEFIDNIERLVQHVSYATSNIEHSEGKQNIRFFVDVLEMVSINPHVDSGPFYRFLLEHIPMWAPRLLTYYDFDVRNDTEEYLQGILFRNTYDPEEGVSEEVKENAQATVTTVRTLGNACLRFLHAQYIRSRTQVVRANVLEILNVIEWCKQYFDASSEDPEDVLFQESYMTCLPALRRLMIDELEDDASEGWENSDEAFSSSEVLDPTIDAAGATDVNDAVGPADMDDSEVQL